MIFPLYSANLPTLSNTPPTNRITSFLSTFLSFCWQCNLSIINTPLFGVVYRAIFTLLPTANKVNSLFWGILAFSISLHFSTPPAHTLANHHFPLYQHHHPIFDPLLHLNLPQQIAISFRLMPSQNHDNLSWRHVRYAESSLHVHTSIQKSLATWKTSKAGYEKAQFSHPARVYLRSVWFRDASVCSVCLYCWLCWLAWLGQASLFSDLLRLFFLVSCARLESLSLPLFVVVRDTLLSWNIPFFLLNTYKT